MSHLAKEVTGVRPVLGGYGFITADLYQGFGGDTLRLTSPLVVAPGSVYGIAQILARLLARLGFHFPCGHMTTPKAEMVYD